MPPQRPQLLEPHFPGGPIQEKGVYKPVVPVDADAPHVIISSLLTIKLRRCFFLLRPSIVPLSTQEQWDITCSFNIGSPPVINFSLATTTVSWFWIITPAIYPIAAFERLEPILVLPEAPGGRRAEVRALETGGTNLINPRLCGIRTAGNVGLILVVRAQRAAPGIITGTQAGTTPTLHEMAVVVLRVH